MKALFKFDDTGEVIPAEESLPLPQVGDLVTREDGSRYVVISNKKTGPAGFVRRMVVCASFNKN